MKYITILCIFVSLMIFAQSNTEAFLNLYPSAYGEGMQGNLLSNNKNLFFYNPANNANKLIFEYEHKFLMNSISQYNFANSVFPIFNNISIGLAYISQYISDIPEYPEYSEDVSFIPIGQFNDIANAFYFNFSYAYYPSQYSLYSIQAGVNIKYIYHTIYDNVGIGTGLDMGITCNVDLNRVSEKLTGIIKTSLIVDDIANTQIKWDTPSSHIDSRDMSFKTGISYYYYFEKIISSIISEINYKRIGDSSVLGLSIIYDYNDLINIFSGINIEKNEAIDIKNPGFGIAINVIEFNIQYAISKNNIGYNHSLGIKYSL